MEWSKKRSTQTLMGRMWSEWLGREWDAINFGYRLRLTRPLITVKASQSRYGQWNPVTRTITINRALIERHPWHLVVTVLKHEIAHQYVSEYIDEREVAHGAVFKRICHRLGLPEWASKASGELPSEFPDWRKTSLTDDEKKLLERTNKLLALAQSDNEHEASLAMQRVRELHAKYNLDQIELRKEAQFVSWVINFGKKRIEVWQSIILVLLDRHFFVRTITFQEFDAQKNEEFVAAEITGKRQHVLMAEYVYGFLERTVHSLWESHIQNALHLQTLRPGQLRSERRHYLIGVLDGFLKQLEESRVDVSGGRNALIRVADQELDGHFRRKFPRISRRSSGGFNPHRDTYRSGVAEGKRLKIHKAVGNSEGFLGRLLVS